MSGVTSGFEPGGATLGGVVLDGTTSPVVIFRPPLIDTAQMYIPATLFAAPGTDVLCAVPADDWVLTVRPEVSPTVVADLATLVVSPDAEPSLWAVAAGVFTIPIQAERAVLEPLGERFAVTLVGFSVGISGRATR